MSTRESELPRELAEAEKEIVLEPSPNRPYADPHIGKVCLICKETAGQGEVIKHRPNLSMCIWTAAERVSHADTRLTGNANERGK